MKQTKRWTALVLAVGMALALVACGGTAGQGDAPGAEPSPAPSATATPAPDADAETGVVINLGGEPQSLDPARNAAADGAILIGHLFEGLMKWSDSGHADEDGLGRAEVTYGQAEGYDRVENADGTVTYTFHLRPGIRWSDGKAVTAQDFVYAWQRLVDPATAATYHYLLDCVVNAQEIGAGTKEPTELAVRAEDEATFAVTVQDVPYFLQLCALPPTCPVRQDVVEQNASQWAYDPETCIGNGMYKLADWSHSAQLVLEANDQYYDPDRVVAKTLTFALTDDEAAVLSAYQAGGVDLALCVPDDQITQLLDDGTLSLADYAGVYYLSFQTQTAPFDDAGVRQAFTLAVDREHIVETVTRGGQTPAGGFVPRGISDAQGDFRAVGGDYLDPSADGYEDNADRARELLAQAGYPGGAGFPEVTYLYSANPVHRAVAQALQEMWQEVLGVTVTLDEREWGAFLQARRQGEFSIARGAWTADYDDPAGFLELYGAESAANEAGYENADYDSLLRQARGQTDPARRMELLHLAEDLLIGRDYALCPLYFYTRPYLRNEDLEGVYGNALGGFFFNGCKK